MTMVGRLKRAWRAFNSQPLLVVNELSMSPSQAQKLAEATGHVVVLAKDVNDFRLVSDEPSLGDGKAEFIGEGTESEFLEQEQADKGNKPWLDRLKQLI